MYQLKPTQLCILEKVRSLLPHNLYLGGSEALKLHYPVLAKSLGPSKDLDLFIYQDRPMEKAVILDCLTKVLGFTLIKLGVNYDGEYKIPGQYWYIKVEYLGVFVDLIFIRPGLAKLSLGSTLAAVQYEVNYSKNLFDRNAGGTLFADIVESWDRAKVVSVMAPQCTEGQLEKINQRAKL